MSIKNRVFNSALAIIASIGILPRDRRLQGSSAPLQSLGNNAEKSKYQGNSGKRHHSSYTSWHNHKVNRARRMGK